MYDWIKIRLESLYVLYKAIKSGNTVRYVELYHCILRGEMKRTVIYTLLKQRLTDALAKEVIRKTWGDGTEKPKGTISVPPSFKPGGIVLGGLGDDPGEGGEYIVKNPKDL